LTIKRETVALDDLQASYVREGVRLLDRNSECEEIAERARKTQLRIVAMQALVRSLVTFDLLFPLDRAELDRDGRQTARRSIRHR
jgi:hypothetical protein